MHLIVVGLSHKTAPVEIRERLAVPESRLGEALIRLCSYPGVKEGVLLSTCNRVEVYSVVDDIDTGYGRIQEFLADTHLSLVRTVDPTFILAYRGSGDRPPVSRGVQFGFHDHRRVPNLGTIERRLRGRTGTQDHRCDHEQSGEEGDLRGQTRAHRD